MLLNPLSVLQSGPHYELIALIRFAVLFYNNALKISFLQSVAENDSTEGLLLTGDH